MLMGVECATCEYGPMWVVGVGMGVVTCATGEGWWWGWW